jgi:hypothetical protein
MDDHPQLRADWILFLLGEVKGFVSADEYEAILEKLNDDVADLREEASQ